MAQVSSLEAGLTRVLAMMGEKAKPLPALPSFDDLVGEETPIAPARSPFVDRLERANRIGSYKYLDPEDLDE